MKFCNECGAKTGSEVSSETILHTQTHAGEMVTV